MCLTLALPQLYRCWVIYSMDLWVIVFPCLMYFGSLGIDFSSPRTVNCIPD